MRIAPKIIAVFSPGIMGASVGGALVKHGCDVITDLTGRSAQTAARAERFGLRAASSLDAAVEEADLVLSIVPPEFAHAQAELVCAAMKRTGAWPDYGDLNAISPQAARQVAGLFAGTNCNFVDGGIIGGPPHEDHPRIFVSGDECSMLLALDGMEMIFAEVDGGIGQASALKMCFAGINKGTNALLTAAMLAADKLGVRADLVKVLQDYQPPTIDRMRRVIPRLPSDAQRYIYEMEEIAATFQAVGAPGGFHDGSADMYRILAASPFASETRETLDQTRTMETTIEGLGKGKGRGKEDG